MTELDPNGSFVTFEQAVIDGAEKRAASIIVEAQQYREGELRAASQGNGPEDLETRRLTNEKLRRELEDPNQGLPEPKQVIIGVEDASDPDAEQASI